MANVKQKAQSTICSNHDAWMSRDGLGRGAMSCLPGKALRRHHCQMFQTAQNCPVHSSVLACVPTREAPHSREHNGNIEANTRACTDTDKPVSGSHTLMTGFIFQPIVRTCIFHNVG